MSGIRPKLFMSSLSSQTLCCVQVDSRAGCDDVVLQYAVPSPIPRSNVEGQRRRESRAPLR